MPNKLKFIKSTRFWAMIAGAVILYLQKEGIVDDNLALLLETIFAGFIGIRTIDRAAEKVGDVDTGKPVQLAPEPEFDPEEMI